MEKPHAVESSPRLSVPHDADFLEQGSVQTFKIFATASGHCTGQLFQEAARLLLPVAGDHRHEFDGLGGAGCTGARQAAL